MIEHHQLRIVDAYECRKILDLALPDQRRGYSPAHDDDRRFPDIEPDRFGKADRFIAAHIDIPFRSGVLVASRRTSS
jgi:hypothetical protein